MSTRNEIINLERGCLYFTEYKVAIMIIVHSSLAIKSCIIHVDLQQMIFLIKFFFFPLSRVGVKEVFVVPGYIFLIHSLLQW